MSDDPNAGFRAEMKGIYAEIWDKAHAAGWEAGMREAAKIAYEWKVVDANGDEILMVNAGQWVAGAIEDAIRTQEDSTSE